MDKKEINEESLKDIHEGILEQIDKYNSLPKSQRTKMSIELMQYMYLSYNSYLRRKVSESKNYHEIKLLAMKSFEFTLSILESVKVENFDDIVDNFKENFYILLSKLHDRLIHEEANKD